MRTFTIYMAPAPRTGQPGQPGPIQHLWYALSDGTGAPPLIFGRKFERTHSPFAADYRCADGEPNYLDPNIDHPIMARTMQITKKEFNIIKRFGEGLGV